MNNNAETLTDIYDRLRKIKRTKMKKTIVGAVAVLGMVGLVGCTEDPCKRLAPPTAAESSAVAAGSEVEREVANGRVDCELVNGTWQRESK